MTPAELQELIDSGMAWRLEGAVGRACMAAIMAGECMLGPVAHTDYYGNYVPSRYEIRPGSPGSPEYCNATPLELSAQIAEANL